MKAEGNKSVKTVGLKMATNNGKLRMTAVARTAQRLRNSRKAIEIKSRKPISQPQKTRNN